jgi:hypothetical protein
MLHGAEGIRHFFFNNIPVDIREKSDYIIEGDKNE